MPDQFGNPTPQDILTQITNENNVMMSQAQTPSERRLAGLYTVGRAVSAGLDPRLVKAKDIQGAMAKGMKLNQLPNESALSYEIRRGRQMFTDMKDVDPTTAAEISSKLTELEAERAQQARLQAEEERDVARFGFEKEQHAHDVLENKENDVTKGLFYEVDPHTYKTTGETTSVGDVDHEVKVNEFRARGNILLTSDDINAAGINADAANFKLLGSDFGGKTGTVSAAIETTNVANGLMDVFLNAGKLGENPMTFVDKVARGIQPYINAASEASKALGHGSAPPVGSPEFLADQSIFEEQARRRGQQSQVPLSLMVQLTYTWAKSFDNRVTEQDYLNVYSMLGGDSGSPSTIAATIRDMTFGRYGSLTDTVGLITNDLLTLAPEGSIGNMQGKALSTLMDRYKLRTDEFRTKSDQLMKSYGATDRHSPGAGQLKPNERMIGGRKMTARPGGQ